MRSGINLNDQTLPTELFDSTQLQLYHSAVCGSACNCVICVLAPPPQGFEWNKYNQTHYDTDSPPPKIVQGYKFNVRALGSIPNATYTHIVSLTLLPDILS